MVERGGGGAALFTAFWATEKIGLPRPENKVNLFNIDGHWSLIENQTRKSMMRSISETGAGLSRGNKGGKPLYRRTLCDNGSTHLPPSRVPLTVIRRFKAREPARSVPDAWPRSALLLYLYTPAVVCSATGAGSRRPARPRTNTIRGAKPGDLLVRWGARSVTG